jgi:hypothetical protein
MDSRWALKARVGLVGYMGQRLRSEWSFRIKSKVGEDLAVGSSEAIVASEMETCPGKVLLVPEKRARMKTVMFAMKTRRVLVLTALGEYTKYGFTTLRIIELGQKEREVL